MNVLTYTSLWPNAERPDFAVFVKHRVAAMARLADVNIRIVAPLPYFPRQFQFSFVPSHWRRAAGLPEREEIAGLETHHPRHLVTPKLGMSFYSRWMANGTEPLVRRLHAERPIDAIDAHYVYPDGHAAILLGERLRIPVVITARGTDINHFSRMRLIRPMIRDTLRRAAGVIAVSDALKQRMIELGIEEEKIAVIRNGVDNAIFYPRDRAESRQRLGLDAESKIAVAAGALVPLKGFDRLIDAMTLVEDPRVKLYIIGEGAERAKLQSRIAARNLTDRVFLPGARPQSELAEWYSAADVFCLASHREGCPNVVIEAMACGAPVVAADVGAVRELVSSADFGRVVSTPTAESFAEEIQKAMQMDWDRKMISAHGGARSWAEVAEEVMRFYSQCGISPRPPGWRADSAAAPATAATRE